MSNKPPDLRINENAVRRDAQMSCLRILSKSHERLFTVPGEGTASLLQRPTGRTSIVPLVRVAA